MIEDFDFIEKKERIIAISLFAIYLIISIFYVVYGRLTLEEGANVYAAKLVYSGKLLYRDFQYSQMPLLPYVYGLIMKVTSTNLYAGRIIGMTFGLLSSIFAYFTARRISGKLAALMTLVIITTNQVALLYFAKPLTYSLAAFFITLSALLLTSKSRNVHILALLAAILALGVRFIFIIAVISIFIYIVYFNYRRIKYISVTLFAIVASLAAMVGPFLVMSKTNFLYWPFASQLERGKVIIYYKGTPDFIVWFNKLNYAFGSISSYQIAILLLSATTIFSIYLFLKSPSRKKFLENNALLIVYSCIIFGSVFINSLAYPAYVHYHALILPLAAITIAVTLVKLIEHLGKETKWSIIAITTILLIINSVPSQGNISKVNPIRSIWQVNELVRRYTTPGDELLTFSTVAAVENDRELPHGLERGIYTYHPTDPVDWARKYNIFSTKALLKYIRSRKSKLVLLTDRYFYGYHLEPVPKIRKKIVTEIKNNYRLIRTVPDYTDFGNCYVYLAKDISVY